MKTITGSKSVYNYSIKNEYGKNIISIVDLNVRGSKSVTNNIENVVHEIADTLKVDPKLMVIVYRDTEGYWDGWDAAKNDFILIGSVDEDLAIKRCIGKL